MQSLDYPFNRGFSSFENLFSLLKLGFALILISKDLAQVRLDGLQAVQ